MAHGEVVTWVSCHSDRPMWTCATLGVLSKMYRKLLVDNLSIVWNNKVLCCVQNFMEIGDITLEEFEKVSSQVETCSGPNYFKQIVASMRITSARPVTSALS